MDQTLTALRHGIRTGHWQERLPAERELARHLQVGRKTLRAALEQLERDGTLDVTGRQRRRISSPPSPRRSPAQKQTVGILMSQPFQMAHARRMFVINAVRENLARAGCRSEMHLRPRCFSAHPARALAQLTRDHPRTVWLVFGSREPMQRWFIEARVPCLVIGSPRPDLPLPSIDVDHHAACHHAGHFLVRKGHRQLALVLPLDAFDGDASSEQGFRESLATQSGAQLQILRHDGTRAHLCSLLDKALRGPAPPTACLVARASHALTVTMHLLRLGKRLPRDLAIISRDDDSFLSSTTPAIARYVISHDQFARRVSLAARQLAETSVLPSRAIRLMPDFLPGETV